MVCFYLDENFLHKIFLCTWVMLKNTAYNKHNKWLDMEWGWQFIIHSMENFLCGRGKSFWWPQGIYSLHFAPCRGTHSFPSICHKLLHTQVAHTAQITSVIKRWTLYHLISTTIPRNYQQVLFCLQIERCCKRLTLFREHVFHFNLFPHYSFTS